MTGHMVWAALLYTRTIFRENQMPSGPREEGCGKSSRRPCTRAAQVLPGARRGPRGFKHSRSTGEPMSLRSAACEPQHSYWICNTVVICEPASAWQPHLEFLQRRLSAEALQEGSQQEEAGMGPCLLQCTVRQRLSSAGCAGHEHLVRGWDNGTSCNNTRANQ